MSTTLETAAPPARPRAALAGERVNVHVYQSPCTHESRILKITQTLVDHGVFDRVLVIARWHEGIPQHERVDARREIWRLPAGRGPFEGGFVRKGLKVLSWMARVVTSLRGVPVACINCHSLAVFPVCFLLKLWKRCPLVYDTHEMETLTTNTEGLRKAVAGRLERFLIRYADAVGVVNQPIADWYQNEYSLKKAYVVRNIPHPPDPTKLPARSRLREHFGLRDTDLMFLYQGLISIGREVDLMLETFARQSPDKHIVFMGMGPLAGQVQEYAAKYANIHYHPAVPPGDIPRHTAGADVGIWLGDARVPNQYYNLPNKFFEYLMCGVPVLVSDFPCMGPTIRDFDCGWPVGEAQADFPRLVESITRAEVERKRANAWRAGRSFSWRQEEPAVLAIYQDLGLTR